LPLAPTVELLADALALTPDQRTALLAAAGRASLPSSLSRRLARPVAPRVERTWPPLVARASELACIERLLAGDGPPLLLLAGEPGIGKSRRLDEAALRAAKNGWRVLAGGCQRRSGQELYAPFVATLANALRDVPPAAQRRQLAGCSWLVRLLPELAETTLVPAPAWKLPPDQERRLLFAAVGRFLTHVAGSPRPPPPPPPLA